jgi:hypothetical protein
MVIEQSDPLYMSPEHRAMFRTLELRLQSLQQQPRIHDSTESLEDTASRFIQMAELCRLAALLYLESALRDIPSSHETVKKLADDSFALLGEMGPCERPWSLFVLALESRSDAEKKMVLDVVARTLEVRPLGNSNSTMRVIQAAWVQQDEQWAVRSAVHLQCCHQHQPPSTFIHLK